MVFALFVIGFAVVALLVVLPLTGLYNGRLTDFLLERQKKNPQLSPWSPDIWTRGLDEKAAEEARRLRKRFFIWVAVAFSLFFLIWLFGVITMFTRGKS